MATAVELLRQGRRDEFWQRYCGFLDLGIEEFLAIQERLLREQLQLLAGSELGRKFVGSAVPTTVSEFRRTTPLTTYADYVPYFAEQREDILPVKPVCWMRTSGRTGEYRGKWVPVSSQNYTQMSRALVTTLTLASARYKGEITLEENASLLYTAAPPPYITGTTMRAATLEFPFRPIPPIEEAERMSFQERIQEGFMRSMGSGIDYFVGVASALMRIGEAFSGGTRQMHFTPALLRPETMARLGKAFLASKLSGRAMLPKDIWRPKGIVASGMDAHIYKQRIKELWGRDPLEAYACTEIGPIAYQAWGEKRQGMTFVPDTAFWEYMPEAEYRHWRTDPSYRPQTLLLSEVIPGKYVLVATSLGGGAFIRYVIGDLVRVTTLGDDELGITLPQFVMESRADEVINIGSMFVLTERSLWQAFGQLGVGTVDWVARKEFGLDHGHAVLHMYVEGQHLEPERLQADLHDALIETHEEYASFSSIMEFNPLRVTLLAPGTFQGYLEEKQAQGADLGHFKPPRMQPADQILGRLIAISAKRNGSTR